MGRGRSDKTRLRQRRPLWGLCPTACLGIAMPKPYDRALARARSAVDGLTTPPRPRGSRRRLGGRYPSSFGWQPRPLARRRAARSRRSPRRAPTQPRRSWTTRRAGCAVCMRPSLRGFGDLVAIPTPGHQATLNGPRLASSRQRVFREAISAGLLKIAHPHRRTVGPTSSTGGTLHRAA